MAIPLSNAPTALSAVTPDVIGNKSLFLQLLAQQPTWTDQYTGSIGNTIIDLLASGTAFSQFEIERGIQECFPDTAQSDVSVFAAMSMLGVRLSRKLPSSATVTVTSTVDVNLPPYHVFDVGGVAAFNETSFLLPAKVPHTFTLHEGTVHTTSFVSDGSIFQRHKLGVPNFVVGDASVYVTVNDVPWTRTTAPLWHYANDNVFYDRTLPDGDVELLFGNGFVGAVPPIGSTIRVTYGVTNGTTKELVNQTVVSSAATTATATSPAIPPLSSVTTLATLGAEPKTAQYYKALGSQLSNAGGRAVTYNDVAAIGTSMPNVIDCKPLAQRDINPADPTLMNVVNLVILVPTTWTAQDTSVFLAAMNEPSNKMMSTFYTVSISGAINQAITGTIYVLRTAIAADVVAAAQDAVAKYFASGVFSIGRGLVVSDIYNIVTSTPGVDYLVLSAPLNDVVVQPTEHVHVTGVSFTSAVSTR